MTPRTQRLRLNNGAQALVGLDEVGRNSYEGGDTDGTGEWYEDYRVWPAEGVSKRSLSNAVERLTGDGWHVTVSPTRDSDPFIYVAVRA